MVQSTYVTDELDLLFKSFSPIVYPKCQIFRWKRQLWCQFDHTDFETGMSIFGGTPPIFAVVRTSVVLSIRTTAPSAILISFDFARHRQPSCTRAPEVYTPRKDVESHQYHSFKRIVRFPRHCAITWWLTVCAVHRTYKHTFARASEERAWAGQRSGFSSTWSRIRIRSEELMESGPKLGSRTMGRRSIRTQHRERISTTASTGKRVSETICMFSMRQVVQEEERRTYPCRRSTPFFIPLLLPILLS